MKKHRKRAIIMAYKVIILYQLYMPSYFLGTFTEYPYVAPQAVVLNKVVVHEEALVGTAAMVNKDVPAGRTVVGCPAELKEDYTALRERLKSLLL